MALPTTVYKKNGNGGDESSKAESSFLSQGAVHLVQGPISLSA
jgi:hypothetical protein